MLNAALLLLCLFSPSPAPAEAATAAPTAQGAGALRSVAWRDEPRARPPVAAAAPAGASAAASAVASAELRDPFVSPRRTQPVAAPVAGTLRDPFRARVRASAPTVSAPAAPTRVVSDQGLRDPFERARR